MARPARRRQAATPAPEVFKASGTWEVLPARRPLWLCVLRLITFVCLANVLLLASLAAGALALVALFG